MKSVLFVDQYLYEDDQVLRRELNRIYDAENPKTEDQKMGRLMEAIEARGEARGLALGKRQATVKGVLLAYELQAPVEKIAHSFELTVDQVLEILKEHQS